MKLLVHNNIFTFSKTKKSSAFKIIKFIGEANVRVNISKDQKQTGKWLREQIIELGPAFIKFGQFVSTRNDLLGKEITDELLLLQDNIPQVPFSDLISILNESYGDYTEIFSQIDETALASASIGQVHIGYLRENNKKVAIKIHKPNISEKIKEDIDILKNLITISGYFGYNRANEFESVINEYERFLSAELDFRKEMKHMVRFKRLLVNLPVKIPDVSVKLSSQKVLVMEYVKSTKINELDKYPIKSMASKEIATSLINLFLYQIIRIGYVHSDPHPGNIGVLEDGRIVLYDFGNVVRFSDAFKSKINQLIILLYQRDVEEFVDLLIELEILYVTDDIEIIEIKAFFGYFFKYLENLDLSTLKVSVIQNDLQGKFQTNFKVNQDFLSLFRVFSLLDGTYLKLDPDFNYINAIGPYTDDLMNKPEFYDYRAKKDIEKLRSYPRILQNTDSNILRLQQKTKKMNNDFYQLQIFVVAFTMIDNYEHVLPLLMLAVPFYYYKNKKD